MAKEQSRERQTTRSPVAQTSGDGNPIDHSSIRSGARVFDEPSRAVRECWLFEGAGVSAGGGPVPRNTVRPMADDRETEVWRSKDGRAWRIGRDAEIAWIRENTEGGLAITSAIPPVFEAYATLELPGSGDHDAASWLEDPDRHDAGVLAVLSEHATAQPWWLGYLDTGAADVVFDNVWKVKGYSADWWYVLIEAGPEQAGVWRRDERWKGVLPDLMFPADRSWLVSTLWDDDWTCIGGSRGLVDAFVAHPDLRHRAREVDPSVKDATPPRHTAI
jgi:hypothetical protein